MDSAISPNGATGQAHSALGGNETTANETNEQSTAADTYNNQVNSGATGSDEAEVLSQDNNNQANQGAAGMDFDFGITWPINIERWPNLCTGFDDWNLLPNQAELDYFSGFYETDIDSPYFPAPAMDGTYNPYGDNAFESNAWCELNDWEVICAGYTALRELLFNHDVYSIKLCFIVLIQYLCLSKSWMSISFQYP